MNRFNFSSLAFLRHHFMRGVVVKMVLQTLFFLLLIEWVFLAEKFSAIFELGVEAHASLSHIFLLLFFSSPEIFDVALAIAVLIGVYRALLRAREDRELLVMSSAGMGINQLMIVLVGVALLAQAASLFVSGTLGPLAQYGQRVIVFDAQYRALREGGSSGQFYSFPNHEVFVGRRTADSDSRRLFIKQEMGDISRIITADKASLEGPDRRGMMALQLRDFLAYDFEPETANPAAPKILCPGCPVLPESAPSVTMRVRNFTQTFQLDQLLAFAPRGSDNVAEWTLMELLGVSPPPAPLGHAETKSLGERFASSLLCLLAPLLGTLAIAFTTRGTETIALPLACVALLGLHLFASALVSAIAPWGNTVLLEILGALTVPLLLFFIVWVVRAQRALVRPALGRP